MSKQQIRVHPIKSGVSNYIAQRVTAIILVPCSIWFVVFIAKIVRAETLTDIGIILSSPAHVITAMVFMLSFLYHGLLGMKEIIEDYVHCHVLKRNISICLLIITVVSGIAGIFSVTYFYVISRLFIH